MPEAFERCRKAGGDIRTIKGPNKHFNVPAGSYRHICIARHKEGPKIAWGELHKKEKK